MAPHLSPQVIAAIETAVECNGDLESAFIHSLAKIYKTSPQAIVWNMKRYNKVTAGCDDRQKTGRRPVLDKDAVAAAIKEWLGENPRVKINAMCQMTLEKFGTSVSGTWMSRLIKDYEIVYRVPLPPKPPRIPKPPKVRVEKTPKPLKIRKQKHTRHANMGQYADFMNVVQYQPPDGSGSAAGQYPTFRQDLRQAIAAPENGIPATHISKEPDHAGIMFGILKPSVPPPKRPVGANQYTHPPPQYTRQNHNSPIFSPGAHSLTESTSPSTADEATFILREYVPRPAPVQPKPTAAAANSQWEVLKVVELP